jgi:hypothetical protein
MANGLATTTCRRVRRDGAPNAEQNGRDGHQLLIVLITPGAPAGPREILPVELLRQVRVQNLCVTSDAPTAAPGLRSLYGSRPIRRASAQPAMVAWPYDPKVHYTKSGTSVDHATIYRWTVHYAPLLLEQFNRRKRPVTGGWHVDET